MYEIFHGDGGHGGPYKSLGEAIITARKLAREAVSSVSLHAIEVIKEYSNEGPDGMFKARVVVKAHRCLDCNEVHCCVSVHPKNQP